jgi:uncharacterized protein
MKLNPFHLAIQVRDLDEARDFYGTKLGFPEGRSSAKWIDFDMHGHQFVTHLNTALGRDGSVTHAANPVDGKGIPVPHFGVVLDFAEWEALASKARGFIDEFIVEPHIRFEGQPGEQGTMFFADPSGNVLEFKTFRDIERQLFAK